MKTKAEWGQDVINITNTIHQKFPELSKYIAEMPMKSSGKDDVTVKNLEDYYHSLEDFLNKYAKTHADTKGKFKPPMFSGYPLYPPSEDIYQHFKEETDLNPEEPAKKKTQNEAKGSMNEKSFKDDMSGDDLDVPGSELDDQQESVGSENEANNYYSLGGDNHNDLEEDKS